MANNDIGEIKTTDLLAAMGPKLAVRKKKSGRYPLYVATSDTYFFLNATVLQDAILDHARFYSPADDEKEINPPGQPSDEQVPESEPEQVPEPEPEQVPESEPVEKPKSIWEKSLFGGGDE